MLRGAKRIILSGDLVAQNAHEDSAIIAERKKREKMANRVVQTGGVITVKDARRIKRAREGEEEEKENKREKARATKRNKLLAADNKRRSQAGLPVIPDHAGPVLNPDYINWDQLQRTKHYEHLYNSTQRQESEEENEDALPMEFELEDGPDRERDELGRGLGDQEEDLCEPECTCSSCFV
jgi:hypothetical protein